MKLPDVMDLLKSERIRKGISLEEVAKRGGWSNESVPRSMEKPGANPQLRSIQRYAAAVNISDFKIMLEQTQKPTTITFFLHAGGVGKSTAVRDIGFALSEGGFRVLLIDTDSQANLTTWLGVRDVSLAQTIYPAIIGDEDALHLPEPITVHGMHLIPAQTDIAKIDMNLPGVFMGVTRLKEAVARLEGYDFILIDPPPGLHSLTQLAVIAADHVVVPAATNNKSLEGIMTVIDMVKQYRRANPELRIRLFVPTLHDARTNHNRETLAYFREQLSSIAPVASPLTYRPAVYQDASLNRKPVAEYSPKDPAVEEIQTVTSELLNVLGVDVAFGVASHV